MNNNNDNNRYRINKEIEVNTMESQLCIQRVFRDLAGGKRQQWGPNILSYVY